MACWRSSCGSQKVKDLSPSRSRCEASRTHSVTASGWSPDAARPRHRRRVARDLATVGDRVGLRDFEGRSFRGWHRHTTLAAVAHAASLLTGVTDASGPFDQPRPRLTA
ncbi:hypothetical protein SAURM35S_09798 [Streptomyces aurantiogriseus]